MRRKACQPKTIPASGATAHIQENQKGNSGIDAAPAATLSTAKGHKARYGNPASAS